MSKKKEMSKLAYIDPKKLDDLYHARFLRELYQVKYSKLEEFIAEYYPDPSAMEMIEIQHLLDIIKTKDNDLYEKKLDRMIGKARQILEMSGKDGGAIKIENLSEDELKNQMVEDLQIIMKGITKLQKKKE